MKRKTKNNPKSAMLESVVSKEDIAEVTGILKTFLIPFSNVFNSGTLLLVIHLLVTSLFTVFGLIYDLDTLSKKNSTDLRPCNSVIYYTYFTLLTQAPYVLLMYVYDSEFNTYFKKKLMYKMIFEMLVIAVSFLSTFFEWYHISLGAILMVFLFSSDIYHCFFNCSHSPKKPFDKVINLVLGFHITFRYYWSLLKLLVNASSYFSFSSWTDFDNSTTSVFLFYLLSTQSLSKSFYHRNFFLASIHFLTSAFIFYDSFENYPNLHGFSNSITVMVFSFALILKGLEYVKSMA